MLKVIYTVRYIDIYGVSQYHKFSMEFSREFATSNVLLHMIIDDFDRGLIREICILEICEVK